MVRLERFCAPHTLATATSLRQAPPLRPRCRRRGAAAAERGCDSAPQQGCGRTYEPRRRLRALSSARELLPLRAPGSGVKRCERLSVQRRSDADVCDDAGCEGGLRADRHNENVGPGPADRDRYKTASSLAKG